ncbi:flagellin [Salinibacter ruber]|uniref:flagellin N-terminal helical domain-containing protein n=1 Tax=Salinibacter ruber TaxID=146919 RepID=UPI0021670996|nr:flagellin [Salinibacter ruber]MCS4192433.1 flagellin [Salinibacter ruber]
MANAFRINTNIQAQQAFQNLQSTNDQLSGLRERLTTGKRVNEASDDAAGFEIANKLEAKTGAQGQALRNIGDAKSALSTAEGALDSQLSILQTAKEKATQAANGSLSQDERDAIGNELNELASEINDIQQNATFNGDQLLSGDGSGNAKSFKFQTGTQSSGSKGQFSVDLKSSSTTDLGLGGNLALNTSDGATEALSVDQGSFNNSTGAGLIRDELQTNNGNTVDVTGNADVGATTDGNGNLKSGLEGGEFNIDVTNGDSNNLEFQVSKNGEVQKTQSVGVGTDLSSDANLTLESGGSSEIKLNVGKAFKNDDVSAGETKQFSVEVTDGKLGDSLVGSSDESDARNIISEVDTAIDTVSSELSNLGASQNRLSFKESNLETSKTNLESARSRIEDADFAQTQTQIAKLQVQQQSGVAQLAQANAAGQSVLSLLQ